MNKASKVFNRWMHEYLNGGRAYTFRNDYLQNPPVLKASEVSDSLENIQSNDQGMFDEDWTETDSPILGSAKKDHEFFKIGMDALDDCDPDDYLMYDFYNFKCRPLAMHDLKPLQKKLKDFLCDHLDIKFQIKWILNHKRISDNEMAKKLHFYGNHVSQAQISYFKTGKRKIGNMTLDTANEIALYYQFVISHKQLL